MCQFFGISRAAYYAWVKTMDQPDPDSERLAWVQEAYQTSRRTYGYRRITWWIGRHKGKTINHKAVLRLMNKLNIHSIVRKRKPYKKATQLDTYHRYDNLLNREFTATRPNQKWVTDITFVATQQGWGYLSAIKDLFDGFIVSYAFGRENSQALVNKTVQNAAQNDKVTAELLLHSDQGHQYTSQAYFVLTQQYTITPSMSRRGNCWDNAPMENFFGHLKEEALRQVRTPSFEEARLIIDEYIAFYNYERIQLKTRQTPYETRCLSL
jgi:transposase InsO family protein